MNLSDEMIDEIVEEEGEEEVLEPFTFEELPAPTEQMTIYGFAKRDLHVEDEPR